MMARPQESGVPSAMGDGRDEPFTAWLVKNGAAPRGMSGAMAKALARATQVGS